MPHSHCFYDHLIFLEIVRIRLSSRLVLKLRCQSEDGRAQEMRAGHCNFDSMGPVEQRKAKALHKAQTLHNLYVVRCLQVNEQSFKRYRARILSSIRLVWFRD